MSFKASKAASVTYIARPIAFETAQHIPEAFLSVSHKHMKGELFISEP